PWADAHGIGYLAWTYDTWGNQQALVSNYNGTPTAYGLGFRNYLTTIGTIPAPTPTPTSPPSPTATPTPTPTPAPTPPAVPNFDHIFTVLMENRAYSEVINSPYIASLAKQGSTEGNYFATDHPSLPNYAELTSGQSFPNAATDCDPSASCQSAAVNIADRITASGRTWKEYAESMGTACKRTTSGLYAARHNPFVYYSDISAATCQANVVDYSHLAGDLASTATTPSYAFITPNSCSDMHDCSTAAGDGWLSQNLPQILNSPAFKTQNSLLALVWDEDDGSQSNQVAAIFVGSQVKAGYASAAPHTHYGLLHTIEKAWGLASLTASDANAAPITDIFKPAPGSP